MAVKKATPTKKKDDEKPAKKAGPVVSSRAKAKKVEEVEEKEISKAPIVIKKSAVKPPAAPLTPVAAAPVAPPAPPKAAPAAPAEKTPAKPAAAPVPPAKAKPTEHARPTAPKPTHPVPPRRPPPPPPRPFFSHPKKAEPSHRSSPKVAVPVATATEIGGQTRKKIQFNEMMTVKDLAAAMDVKIPDVIKKLLILGKPATINQRLETETASALAAEFNCELEIKSIYEGAERAEKEDPAKLKQR